MRIVSNCAKSRLRHESRTINFDEPLDQTISALNSDRFDDTGHWVTPLKVWHADTPDAILASDELQNCINRTLRGLPYLQQAIITLRDMQGLDMESICKILEVSESNARVLLHRARNEIRDALDKHQKAP
jgi:RNA polymerase sigma-70 factor (ECF subfamily)